MTNLINDSVRCDSSQKLSDQPGLAAAVEFARYHWHSLKLSLIDSAIAGEVFGRMVEQMSFKNRVWIPVGEVTAHLGIDRDTAIRKLVEENMIRSLGHSGRQYATITQNSLNKLADVTKRLEAEHELPMSPRQFRQTVKGSEAAKPRP